MEDYERSFSLSLLIAGALSYAIASVIADNENDADADADDDECG